MVKAIVRRGEIRPVEPLPPDWIEGETETGKDAFVVYEVSETEPVIVIRPIAAYEPMSE
jgi:hypothetical protein